MNFRSKNGQEYGENAFMKASTITPVAVDWLWKPFIPMRKLTMFEGNGGDGKTTVLLDIAARITRDGIMPDHTQGKTGGVVYIMVEDGVDDTLVPRMIKSGADMDRVIIINHIPVKVGNEWTTRTFNAQEDLPLLEKACEAVGAVMVVIDPIMEALGERVDAYKETEVRRVLNPLIRFADTHNVAMPLIRHFTKAVTDNPMYRGGGSTAFTNVARAALQVYPNPDDEDEKNLVSAKHSLSGRPMTLSYRMEADEHDVTSIKWGKATTKSARELAQDSKPLAEGAQDIMRLLEEAAPTDLTTAEIKASLPHINASTIGVTLKRLQDRKLIENLTHGKYRLKPTDEEVALHNAALDYDEDVYPTDIPVSVKSNLQFA